MTRTARRLRDTVRGLGVEVPDYIEIKRTYAGFWQRAAGAWSWFAVDEEGHELFGSQWTCKQVIEAEKLSVYRPWFNNYNPEIIVEKL